MKSKPFVDTVLVHVAAGNGGDGCVSFRREKFVPRGGPDGGDGGRGGHVILQADPHLDSLTALFFAPHLRAEHGGKGQGNRRHGRNGQDLICRVPMGTVVHTADEDATLLGDLTEAGQQLQIARGGKGGLGNCHWVTPSHRAPREHTDGDPGQALDLRLELKTIADVALVGYPNAGKSSLLDAITRAHSRVGAYPFTTLHPVIGTVELNTPNRPRLRIADVPGLIRDAHLGHGLGIDFLRHVERAPCLIVVVDMAGTEGRDPATDFEQVMTELHHYNADLPDRVALIVANKSDCPDANVHRPAFERRTGRSCLPVSALTGAGIDDLKVWLTKKVSPSQTG